jgi:hypothetical protein
LDTPALRAMSAIVGRFTRVASLFQEHRQWSALTLPRPTMPLVEAGNLIG